MTFDEMVEEIGMTGDVFRSVFRTKDGFQANADSRWGGGACACAKGKTPTEAVRNLWLERVQSVPIPLKLRSNLDDVI